MRKPITNAQIEQKLLSELCNLVDGVLVGAHVNAKENTPQHNQEVFDSMVKHGFKLDLVTGRYYKP